MKTSATAKFVGTSARKTGLVAALIRGRRAVDAQIILANTDKRATGPVGKVLASAIANAENNHNAKAANLMVESVLIGPGPTLKRSMPRAKGSASAIRKRSSHITVVVSDKANESDTKLKTVRGNSEEQTKTHKDVRRGSTGAGDEAMSKKSDAEEAK
jgi:large subunit ribosomal protein L22